MTSIGAAPRSITFGTVLHAAIGTSYASNFREALPDVPLLAKIFGEKFPRITWQADTPTLRTWQTTMRRFVRPYFSKSLDIVSSFIETRLNNEDQVRQMLEVNGIDPVNIMIAGHLRLFAAKSYDRFSTIFPMDVVFTSEHDAISVINPLVHELADPWATDPQINRTAVPMESELTDGWNRWFETGMESESNIMLDDFLRKTPHKSLRQI